MGDPPRGDARRQRIDRLALDDLAGLLDRHHLIGMHDLEILAVEIEPARHHARLAQGELLPRPARSAAEIDEADDIPLPVHRAHPEGAARAGGGSIVRRGQCHDHAAPGVGHVESIDSAAFHNPGRQVEQQIDDARQAQLRQRLGQRSANTFERLGFGEERIEDFRSHH